MYKLVLPLILVLAVTGCGTGQASTIKDLYPAEVNLSGMVMLDGNTGDAFALYDADTVGTFWDDIGRLGIDRDPDQRERTGYLYSVEFLEGDVKAMGLLFGGRQVRIDGVYYQVGDDIGEWLDSLYQVLQHEGIQVLSRGSEVD